MIGVSFGAPTEFRYREQIFEGEFPKWTPERVSNSLNQDDLYVDMTFAKVETEDEPYLHAIPYMQFPVLQAGRPFTGERAMIPGVAYASDQDFWVRRCREAWKYYQANPQGPYTYGGWDAVNTQTKRTVRVRSAARLRRRVDRAPITIGTRVAISIDQGLQKAEGVVREFETDDSGTSYRVDVTSGDQCNEHRTADGELWVCQFEVKPLPA
jgi:hypothetical protein